MYNLIKPRCFGIDLVIPVFALRKLRGGLEVYRLWLRMGIILVCPLSTQIANL